MRVGVSTAAMFMRSYNEDALPYFNEIGVKTAEVFLTTYSEYEEEFARLLKERKGDVAINSVHILNTQFEPQLFNANARVRADAYAMLHKVLACAQILGAPYYTFHGTARMKRAARQRGYDNYPKMIEGFQTLVKTCEEKGVALCLENVEWATYNAPGVFSILAEQIPALRGVLDIKQARISQYPYEEYLQEMGERLAYVHISDWKDGKMCLPGKGDFDFVTLIKRLQDVGFDGALIIEPYNNDYKDPYELKISCEYLQELIDKFGI